MYFGIFWLKAHKRETQTKLSAAPASRPETRVQTSTTPATDLAAADMSAMRDSL